MEERTETILRFRYGSATADEIGDVAIRLVAELADPDSEASRQARSKGLDPNTLSHAEVSVEEEEQGLDAETAIMIGIAVNAGTHVAVRFWDEIIWPRIQRRLGADAVGEREEQEE